MKNKSIFLALSALSIPNASLPMKPIERLRIEVELIRLKERDGKLNDKIRDLVIQQYFLGVTGFLGSCAFIARQKYLKSLFPAGFVFPLVGLYQLKIKEQQNHRELIIRTIPKLEEALAK